jgi:hypothetical protein
MKSSPVETIIHRVTIYPIKTLSIILQETITFLKNINCRYNIPYEKLIYNIYLYL